MDRAILDQWPLAERSAFHDVRPHHWHVQDTGKGEPLLLIHGTGASTHSWRELTPLLISRYRVISVDLPGHGFTHMGSKFRSALDPLARDLARLLAHLEIAPVALIGHSAGAAIALRMAQRAACKTRVIGINPALQPFEGLAGVVFPMAARMMAITPGAVNVMARSMENPSRVLSLLRNTGSDVPVTHMNYYARLFRDRAHVEGTLTMLSQWSLDGLQLELPKIDAKTLFITGSRDRMVPPVGAVEAAHAMPNAEVRTIDGCGHLVHEEAPEAVARRIMAWLDTA